MRFFLDSLSDAAPFDAATCFPVSQFLVDRAGGTDAIAHRFIVGRNMRL